ncbi:MAG TPA: prepilin-type N-terminal cleavage/methylation domain-containing protein [Candidatus Omnitrophota bacterium]|nr:prepilin-type N-terminal cleavage/methylation domain-containing protein [Candidatus Omnitrophota bacterium]
MKKTKEGFTLVEILIIVVIIAVLAAMILPRYVDQSENGYIAEAQSFLGSLRSAIIKHMDLGGFDAWPTIDNDQMSDPAVMNPLGLQPLPAHPNWLYCCGCAAYPNGCYAQRLTTGKHIGAIIYLSEAGEYSCEGLNPYTLIDAKRGCRA